MVALVFSHAHRNGREGISIMHVIKSEVVESKGRKLTVKLCLDEFCDSSPREWSNLGRMGCVHRRYRLGDEETSNLLDKLVSECDGWDEVEQLLTDEYDAVVILPIYMYDHSGIALSTSPFSCRWDSGRLGLIYATREDLKREYGKQPIPLEDVIEILKGEVSTYSAYVSGDVYGFVVEDESGEQLESCWGFIGEADYAMTEGLAAAKYA